MNELQIQITEQGKITTNLEALKTELKEVADRYAGIVVKEDDVALAKKDLAELRKLKTEIEDRRKSVKKQWNEPYNAFETEVKSALAIIEKPIEDIDKQIKDFEAAEKKAKEERCKELYAENVSEEMKPYVSFDRVFDNRWLNKSTKENEIVADLSAAVTQVRADIDAIKALNSEIEEECLKAYQQSGNQLAVAIKRNQDYLGAKQAAEQRIKEEAERKAREEAEQKAKEEETAVAPTACQPAEPIDVWSDEPPMNAPEEKYMAFGIYGEENIEKVQQFLLFSEIKFVQL